MEEMRQEQAGQPDGLHLRLHSRHSPPPAFVPLRLTLRPGASTIDVDRPDVLVGRHTECDVRLPLPDVSRRHCRLQFLEGGWQVTDLGSLNGVQVNGEPVAQSPLTDGDRIKIGGFTFEVALVRAHAPKPEPAEGVLETLDGRAKRKAS